MQGTYMKGKGKANSEFDTLSLRRRVSSTRHMMYHHSDTFLRNRPLTKLTVTSDPEQIAPLSETLTTTACTLRAIRAMR